MMQNLRFQYFSEGLLAALALLSQNLSVRGHWMRVPDVQDVPIDKHLDLNHALQDNLCQHLENAQRGTVITVPPHLVAVAHIHQAHLQDLDQNKMTQSPSIDGDNTNMLMQDMEPLQIEL